MRLDMCRHGVVDGCEECLGDLAVLENKGAVLRVELAELRHEYDKLRRITDVLALRVAAVMNERDKLGAELEDCLSDLKKAHERISELEARDDLIVSLENQLEAERDLRVDAERRFRKLEEEG